MKTNPRHALVGLAIAGSLAVAPLTAENAQATVARTPDTQSRQASDRLRWGSETWPVVDTRQGATDESTAENDNAGVSGRDPDQGVNSDQEFLVAAASGSATEIAAGRLAQERASNGEVRQFGERLEADHQEALRAGASIAQSKGFDVPDAPATPEETAMLADLSSWSGQDFDRAFLRAMVADHEKHIELFEAARVSLSTDVNSYAANQLPALQEHLRTAEELAVRVGG